MKIKEVKKKILTRLYDLEKKEENRGKYFAIYPLVKDLRKEHNIDDIVLSLKNEGYIDLTSWTPEGGHFVKITVEGIESLEEED